jgi:hypothetical protein
MPKLKMCGMILPLPLYDTMAHCVWRQETLLPIATSNLNILYEFKFL